MEVYETCLMTAYSPLGSLLFGTGKESLLWFAIGSQKIIKEKLLHCNILQYNWSIQGQQKNPKIWKLWMADERTYNGPGVRKKTTLHLPDGEIQYWKNQSS